MPAATFPLDGVRVLDLTNFLAGPFATLQLADLGAEVIKVELPGKGDPNRHNGPFKDGVSSYFVSVNRGKKSITLDLHKEAAQELTLDLAKQSDILVENFIPGTMARFGLDYATVTAANPRIIYVSLSGFGQDGPRAQQPAFDAVIQAMAGTMSITGQPEGEPVRVGFSVGDIAAGLYTAIGILAALRERDRSGQGQWLDMAMLDAQVAVLENAFSRYFQCGALPERTGSRHPVVSPFQAFPSADGWVVIAAGHDQQWRRLCQAIGREELIDDPRFLTVPDRNAHVDELEGILVEHTRLWTTARWIEVLREFDIPGGPIHSIADAADDPQLRFRGAFRTLPDPVLGQITVAGAPYRFSRSASGSALGSPLLGEHTQDILAERLGVGPEALAELRNQGAV